MAEDSVSISSWQSSRLDDLPRMEIEQQFFDVRLLVETLGAKIFVARQRQSGRSLVLKCLLKEATKKKDFYREFLFHSSVSSHPKVVKCFDEVFETETCYVLTQELAPVGDLSKYVKKGGLGENRAKSVVKQIVPALEFLHKNNLVHRDVCLENIFVFDRELSNFKLGDLGNAQRVGALVKKSKVRSPWAPPEVSLAVYNEGYYVQSAQDAWQLGILIFVCLTGSYPWSSADITDRHYNSWVAWLKRKTTKTPPRFKGFTPRLLRLLRRLLEPKSDKRSSIKEVHKYLSDNWLVNPDTIVGKTLDVKITKFLSSSTKSLFTRAEKKFLEILCSYVRDQEPQPQAQRIKRVRFACDLDSDSASDVAMATT